MRIHMVLLVVIKNQSAIPGGYEDEMESKIVLGTYLLLDGSYREWVSWNT